MGFPNYVGSDKPSLIVKVYPDNRIENQAIFDPNNSKNYRVLNLLPWVGAREWMLPNIKNITINRSFETDSATCEINIYNPTGSLSPTIAGQASTWNRVLLPNTVIKTYQGYGSNTSQTGTWLIDEVVMENPPGMLTIRGRDLAKLLLEQTLYPPIIPGDYYPCGFCTTNDKQSDLLKRNAKRWIAYNDLSEVVKFFLRLAGFTSWNVESTGIMVTLEEMGNLMLIDGINRIKEIVGYQFFIDRFGIPHFESCEISGANVPKTTYSITSNYQLSSISRKISDNYSRSSIRVRGRTTGGISKVTATPERVKETKTIVYTKRQIFKNYGMGPQSDTQDWRNFKQWVAGLSVSDTDGLSYQWVPPYNLSAGACYYGRRCFRAVFDFQKKVGIVKPMIFWTMSYDTAMNWSQRPHAELARTIWKNGSPYMYGVNFYYPEKEVGIFTTATRRAWNRRQQSVPGTTRTTRTIPGSVETEFEELKVVSGEYKPTYTLSPNHVWSGHLMVPLRGQIRQAIHTEPALKTDAECNAMARLIDFWANIKNNSMSLSVVGDYKHQPGDIVELIEGNTNTLTTVLITGMNSKMDLDSGSWVTALEVFDLTPGGG